MYGSAKITSKEPIIADRLIHLERLINIFDACLSFLYDYKSVFIKTSSPRESPIIPLAITGI